MKYESLINHPRYWILDWFTEESIEDFAITNQFEEGREPDIKVLLGAAASGFSRYAGNLLSYAYEVARQKWLTEEQRRKELAEAAARAAEEERKRAEEERKRAEEERRRQAAEERARNRKLSFDKFIL
jgi:hypothetical protein